MEAWMDGLPYYEITLAFIMAAHLLETYLDMRQHERYKSRREVPPELAAHIEPATFFKSQEYGLVKSTFGFLHSNVNFVETLLVLSLGGIPWLWRQSRSLVQWSGYEDTETKTSLVFCFLYILFSGAMELPFSLYSTFVIEERFGFNKTTLRTFILDRFKILLLVIVLGGPLLYAFHYIVTTFGRNFYIYLWAFLIAVQFAMLWLYPVVIAPLFNKFTLLPDGSLRDRITALAKQVDFPLTKLYTMDASQRSGHSNAMFYGFCRNKRIVLYDTLLQQVDEDGVVAILGHELGHYKLGHVWKNMVIAQMYTFVFFWGFSLCVYTDSVYESFGFTDGNPAFIGLMFFSLLFGPIEHIISFAMHYLSRMFEYQADAFAVELGLELDEPLVRLHIENLGNVDPDPLFSVFHNTHPTLLERIRAMRRLRAKTE